MTSRDLSAACASAFPHVTAPPPRVPTVGDPLNEGSRSRETAARDTGMSSPLRLLFVGTAARFGDPLLQRLEAAGHVLLAESLGAAAIARVEVDEPDAVVMDTTLPDMTGFEVCRQLRAGSDVALLFVTADADLGQRLRGFDAGADDYVVSPADAAELESRVRAVLWRRRAPSSHGAVLRGPQELHVRPRSHEVLVGGRPVALTPKEFALLVLLLERRGEVLSSDDISLTVWGYETMGSRNFVEAHISRLRRKLAAEGADRVIETLRGVGYVVRGPERIDAAS